VEVVNALQAMPYGRPSIRTVDCCVDEWRGTCSSKHALLAAALRQQWPGTQPRLVHRVYHVSTAGALARFGPAVAAVVPGDGLTDVHRYAIIEIDGRDVVIDVTFPGGNPWDGSSSMPLGCGDGEDYPVGVDADAEKRALEQRFCDLAVREPFIAALGRMSFNPRLPA
jgi:hypothetical protein